MFKSKEIFLDATSMMGSVIDLSYSDEQVQLCIVLGYCEERIRLLIFGQSNSFASSTIDWLIIIHKSISSRESCVIKKL